LICFDDVVLNVYFCLDLVRCSSFSVVSTLLNIISLLVIIAMQEKMSGLSFSSPSLPMSPKLPPPAAAVREEVEHYDDGGLFEILFLFFFFTLGVKKMLIFFILFI